MGNLTEQNSYILHTNSPWVCVIKVCSNGGATYLIGEIIAKGNLNIENLMQTFENLFSKTAQQNSMILHSHSPWVQYVSLKFVQMVLPPRLGFV